MDPIVPRFVGIDVAKSTLEVAILPANRPLTIPNTPAGWRQLITRLGTDEPVCIVLEATGKYHLGVTDALTEAGLPPAVLNPAWTRAFAKSEGQRAKTDRVDASMLARYAQQKQPQPRPRLGEAQRQLKELVTCRDGLVKLLTMVTNQEQEATDVSRGFLQATIAGLERQRDATTAAIAALIATDPALAARDRQLQSVPGIGKIVSAVLLAGLSELGTCSHKAVAALIGVAPFAQDSGGTQGQRCISGGRADVRRALYQMANSARRYNPVIRAHYQQLRQRKPHKVAMIACINRMLGILTAMVRDDLTWTELRLVTEATSAPTA
jgi:transposase